MSRKKRILLSSFAIVFGALAFAFLAFWAVFDVAHWQTLDPERLHSLALTSSIYDRNGNLISEVRGSENRTLVTLSSIPLHTQQAFIAAEDLRFYTHPGIDIYRIIGALRSNLQSASFSEGASTITQQLAKLTHLSAEKTIRRKLEEINLALQIEKSYSKEEILEMYLNTVYFGRGAYGIETAALVYFGITASELSLAQSACLAAIIKAPSVYSPHTNPDKNRTRRTYILNTMAENHMISPEECENSKKESIWVLAVQEDKQHYSWYIDEVLRTGSALLNTTTDKFVRGGYSIYTALDQELQAIADNTYRDTDLFPANAADGTPVQSAMAVIDTKDGAVRALIGGRDYTTKRGLNRATQMRRQPGSALKPLAVYGPALEKGYTTASVILDEKTSFNGYIPQNAGDRYYGLVTLRTALRNSLNTTAVRLLEEIGIDSSIRYLNMFGIPTEKSDHNLSLALGSMTYGVTPVELAAAYVPYSNGGTYYPPYYIDRIVTHDGTTVYKRSNAGNRVITEQNAYLMTSLLQSVITNGTGTRMLTANMPLAGKTGTVSMKGGNRDIWMAAYNSELSVSVWMGFDQTDNEHKIPNGVTGGKNTASVAAAFFKKAYAKREKPSFIQPDGLIWLTLDKRALTAKGAVMLASSTTPKDYRISEVFTTSNRPYAVSDAWNAPPAPSSFYVSHGPDGLPQLHFKSSSSARYRIQRDTIGESVILTEMIGRAGENITYNDTSAQPGVLYTYRIIPIHEELLQEGIWLEGKQAVQLARATGSFQDNLFSSLRRLIPALSSKSD